MITVWYLVLMLQKYSGDAPVTSVAILQQSREQCLKNVQFMQGQGQWAWCLPGAAR